MLGFLLWMIPFTLSGQRYINGRITDAENGDPFSETLADCFVQQSSLFPQEKI